MKSMLKGVPPQSPRLIELTDSLSPDLPQVVQQTRDKRASSWLNALPIKEHGLPLNKQEITDSLCLRYNLPQPNLPSYCACGEMFTVKHVVIQEGRFYSSHTILCEIFCYHTSVKCAEMWRHSHSSNHSTMKYLIFSPLL